MNWDSANISSKIILDIAIEHGVKDVVCSPGSRNSSLLIAAEARQQLQKHVITDERTAAFFGFGLALVSRKPVILICTSGSAVLNYAPAVAEAYYQGVPLIVISADRPVEWIDQDDSQTIRQNGVLQNIVKQSFDIPVPPVCNENTTNFTWFCSRIVNEAILSANRNKKGPVHINVQLANPLTEIEINSEGKNSFHRIIREVFAEEKLSPEQMRMLASQAAQKKILLIGGFHAPDKRLNKAVSQFSKLPNVAVMAETIANIHGNREWNIIDAAIAITDKSLLPDIVISFGGAIVSRKLKEFLRNNKNIEHWCLGHSNNISDCFQSLTLKIDVEVPYFIMRLTSLISQLSNTMEVELSVSEYNINWKRIREQVLKRHDLYLKNLPWCDFDAFKTILSSIPSSWNLFLSNGTPIRYAQLFDYDFHASYCNRGVSGIDGCTSTAIGGAVATKVPTALITGDLSFTYDINALSISEAKNSGIIIFVINNNGGGIFRFINSTANLDSNLLDKYFCAAPEVKINKLAEAFGFDYLLIDKTNCKKASPIIKSMCEIPNRKATVIEIATDGSLSADILCNYFNYVKKY